MSKRKIKQEDLHDTADNSDNKRQHLESISEVVQKHLIFKDIFTCLMCLKPLVMTILCIYYQVHCFLVLVILDLMKRSLN